MASPQKLSDRQKKLGPAPFASFEDLSDDFSSPEDRAIEPMPGIEEEKEPKGDYDVSGSTSTVQTPTTPRIDVENPSSPSQTSGESTPERELFSQLVGPIAGGFLETAADVDLRSSAEELVIPDESNKRLTPRLGASSGRDRKVSWDAGDNRMANMSHERKGSASSIRSVDPIFFGAHNTRLSSFSSNVSGYSALSAASSAASRRSPSPHRMLLETSFCGPKRSLGNDDDGIMPKTSTSTLAPSSLSLGTASPKTASPLNSPMSPGYMRKLMVKYVKEPRSRPSSPFELSPAPSPTPSRDRQGSLSLGVSRKETRSPSPHRVTLETSFCGSRQTLPRQQQPEEPLNLTKERSSSLQPTATSRPHSPMPIRYTSEPRSRPTSPCPATLSTCSPLTSRRESRATTRSPSPHRTILETSFVGTKQIVQPDDPASTPSVNGITELGKTAEKTLAAPVIYHREPRSRSASPVRRTSDETDSIRQVSMKTFSSNELDKEVSQLTSGTPSDEVPKPADPVHQAKVQGTPRHLPKPVACPKAPQAFSQKSESLQAIPLDSSDSGKHLDVIDPIPAASSTPSTPFLGRKVSVDNVIRRGSTSADDKYIQDRRKDSAGTLQSGSSDSPDVTKSVLTEVKEEKKDSKKPGVFSALFRRGNKGKKDGNSLQPGSVSRDPSPGRSLGDSGLSADDLDDDDSGTTAFNHQVLETSTDPTGKDHQSSDSEVEGQPKETAQEPEKLGLFTQDSIDEDLPYVPTTLPLERPVAPPVIPARMRIAEVKIVPVERPRCSVSINPCSLNDYVRMTKPPGQEADIKIKLTLARREESEDDPKQKPVPAVKVSLGDVVNWDSFAEKALRSPRVLRRVESQETSWFPTESFANFSNWINPEEIPETTKQPKKIQNSSDEVKNSRKSSLSAVEEEKTVGEVVCNEKGTLVYEETSSVASDERKRKNSASSETALLREVELEDDQDEEVSVVDAPDVPSSIADPCSRLSSSSSSSESDMASEDGDNGCLDAPLISRPATLLSTSPFGMDLDVRSNRSSIAVPSDVPSPDEISISTQS